ncbi:hypothetical protein [Fictibacillus sp. S7]|uniref:hypothetical protein n=1 Tax=Fictibacillus sp. S7 TaxID=2212476 RepID=UPI001010BB84|nr:hypothetical protein [Fictibacillus sp. S7]RXZ00952.1 hypothetical protein DMO16_15580 [Fictibacillus sp. S7]
MKRVKSAKTIENAENLKKKIIHPPELEDALFTTKLPVHAPYEIFEYQGTPTIIAAWFLQQPDLRSKPDLTIREFKHMFKNPTYYNPFDDDDLLPELANLNFYDQDETLEFCNKYGLYGQSVLNNQLHLTADPLKLEVKEEVLINLLESYEEFKRNTAIIQMIIDEYFNEVPLKEKLYEQTNDESLLQEIKVLKRKNIRLVNRGLRFVSPSINLGQEEEPLPSFSSTSLLGAVFYQIREAMTQGKQFRKCMNCGSLFVPRKPNGRFCPPLNYGSHSSCQNSYNQMKSRARKAVNSKGRSIEEVAESIGRPISEVKNWFV